MTDSSLTPDIKFQLIKKIESHKIIGLGNTRLLEHEVKYLELHRTAGVILFERNIETLTQVSDLVASVSQQLATDDGPPLVMADHEGDFVAELKRLIGIPPSAMALAATGDPDLARDVALETGRALAKLGVNVVLAPVADCYLSTDSPVTGLRTFGRDPERVANFVKATLEGFEQAGIVACVKHFPGHGAASGDSHEVLPHIQKDLDELRALDLIPFVSAIQAGAKMMMTAHVAYSLKDAKEVVPASFDPRLLQGLLRDELGFDGVVITDALEMEGARVFARDRFGGLTGGFERSILAGADLLLFASPIPERMNLQDESEPMIAVEVMQTIIETLHKVVDRDRIDRKLEDAAKSHEGLRNLLAILDRSQNRVRRLRQAVADLQPSKGPRKEGNVIHLERYATTPSIYKTVAERSITLVRDPVSFIPAASSTECLLMPIEYIPGESLKRQDLTVFVEGLSRAFPNWRTSGRVVGFETDDDGQVMPLFEAPERKIVLDAQHYAGRPPEGRVTVDGPLVPIFSTRGLPPDEFLGPLSDFLEEQVVRFVIVTGAPIIDWIPESVGCLVTLGVSPQVAAATAAVLAGAQKAKGVLGDIL